MRCCQLRGRDKRGRVSYARNERGRCNLGGKAVAAPASVIPGAGAVFKAAPALSKKLHREALGRATDPEVASRELYASTQEGGQRQVPANLPPPAELPQIAG